MGNKPGYHQVNVDDTSDGGRETQLAPDTQDLTNPAVQTQPKGTSREERRSRHSSASAQLGGAPSGQQASSAAPSETTADMSVRSRHSSLQTDRTTSRPVFANETLSSSLQGRSLVGPAHSQYVAAESTAAMKFLKQCKKLESPKKGTIADSSGATSSRTPRAELQATSSSEYDEVADLIQTQRMKRVGKKTRRGGRKAGQFDEFYTYDPGLEDPTPGWH